MSPNSFLSRSYMLSLGYSSTNMAYDGPIFVPVAAPFYSGYCGSASLGFGCVSVLGFVFCMCAFMLRFPVLAQFCNASGIAVIKLRLYKGLNLSKVSMTFPLTQLSDLASQVASQLLACFGSMWTRSMVDTAHYHCDCSWL